MADPLQTVKILGASARGKPVPFGFVSLVITSFAGKTSQVGAVGTTVRAQAEVFVEGFFGRLSSSRTRRNNPRPSSEWRLASRMFDAAVASLRLRHAIPDFVERPRASSASSPRVSRLNGTTWKAVWISVAGAMFASGFVVPGVQIQADETRTSHAGRRWGASTHT